MLTWDQAAKYEAMMTHRVDGITQNLHRALQTHSRLAHDDITAALIEHARSSLVYERQLLRELEALRPDVANAAAPAPEPSKIGLPIVRPLEEPPVHRPALPSTLQSQARGPVYPNSRVDGLPNSPLGPQYGDSAPYQSPPSPRPAFPSGPLTPAQAAAAAAAAAGHVVRMPSAVGSFAARSPRDPLSPVSPGAGSSRFAPPSPSPLGLAASTPNLRVNPGQSAVAGPSAPSSAVPSPAVASATNGHFDPLRGGAPLSQSTIVASTNVPAAAIAAAAAAAAAESGQPRGAFMDPLSQSAFVGQPQQQAYSPYGGQFPGGDAAGPLGGTMVPPGTMGRSLQLPPARSRLDAREAAAKLANFL